MYRLKQITWIAFQSKLRSKKNILNRKLTIHIGVTNVDKKLGKTEIVWFLLSLLLGKEGNAILKLLRFQRLAVFELSSIECM